jgi:ADP-ribosylglycohydrolase
MGSKGQSKHPVNDSKGCGGVMRAAPAGLVQSDDPFAFGAGTAAITHGHPNGYLAAGALAVIVHNVARDMPLKFAVEAALDRLAAERAHGETTRALEQAVRLAGAGDPSPETVESLGQGWVAEEALAIAVYCALVSPNDVATGVRLAVNHSGDSDSTGAIAGNILGAKLGAGSIPTQWLAVLELRDELEALADDLLTGFRLGFTWAPRYPID